MINEKDFFWIKVCCEIFNLDFNKSLGYVLDHLYQLKTLLGRKLKIEEIIENSIKVLNYLKLSKNREYLNLYI